MRLKPSGVPRTVPPSASRALFRLRHHGCGMSPRTGSARRAGLLLLLMASRAGHSWRKIMPTWPRRDSRHRPRPRGYGPPPGGARTTTTISGPCRLLNAVRDAMGLVAALGHRTVRPSSALISARRSPPGARWRDRRLPVCRVDERALRGPPDLPFDIDAGPSVPRAHHPRGGWRPCLGRASITSGGTRRGRRMTRCALPASVQTSARLLHQRVRTGRTTRRIGCGVVGGRAGQDADLLQHGPRDDMPTAVAKEMPSPARDPRACRWLPVMSSRSTVASISARVSAGLNWYRPAARSVRVRIAAVFGADHRRAVDLHLGQE